jgi:predicted outer membrane protein
LPHSEFSGKPFGDTQSPEGDGNALKSAKRNDGSPSRVQEQGKVMLKKSSAFFAAVACGAYAIGAEPNTKPVREAPPAARENGTATQAPRQAAPNVARPAQPGARIQREAGFRGTENQAQSLDSHVADCLILHSQEEIALLKFARDKTDNKDVQQFADMAIKDHEKGINDLQKFAGRQAADLQVTGENRAETTTRTTRETLKPATTDAAGQPARPVQPPRAQNVPAQNGAAIAAAPAADADANMGSMSDRMFQIEHQAVQNCLSMTKEELAKQKGDHFDKAFLGQQIGMHIGMLAHLKALKGNVSGELQQVVDANWKAASQHKDKAEKLMDQIHHDHEKSGDSKNDSK